MPNGPLFMKSTYSGLLTTLSSAFSSAATISGDAPLGSAIPRQAPIVQLIPSSFSVGTSGKPGSRLSAMFANARTLPAPIRGRPSTRLAVTTCTPPATSSWSPVAAPVLGTHGRASMGIPAVLSTPTPPGSRGLRLPRVRLHVVEELLERPPLGVGRDLDAGGVDVEQRHGCELLVGDGREAHPVHHRDLDGRDGDRVAVRRRRRSRRCG